MRQGDKNRGAVPATRFRDLRIHQARVRREGGVILRTDISECYRSIYTHSISWAVSGRGNNWNDNTILGNAIDRAVRNGQSRQTNGISIGPDSSLMIAELVLCDIDAKLHDRLTPLSGIRFYDDYELAFKDRLGAEQALSQLQLICRDYGFHLNPKKTSIERLPVTFEDPWLHDVRTTPLSGPTGTVTSDRIFSYFDAIIRLKNVAPSINVVPYAISRLASEGIPQDHWSLVQSLTTALVIQEPAAIERLARFYVAGFRRGVNLDIEALTGFLNQFLAVHSPLGHSFEVSWALWLALKLDLQLASDLGDKLTGELDCTASLLALDAKQRGLLQDFPLSDALRQQLDERWLYGDLWLLGYEATQRGWIDNDWANDIAQDPFYSYLRDEDVHFYTKVRKVVPDDDDEEEEEEDFWSWHPDDEADASY